MTFGCANHLVLPQITSLLLAIAVKPDNILNSSSQGFEFCPVPTRMIEIFRSSRQTGVGDLPFCLVLYSSQKWSSGRDFGILGEMGELDQNLFTSVSAFL